MESICRKLLISVCLLAYLSVANGCVYSSLQSGRLLQEKQLELTPHLSSVSYSADGSIERIQTEYGLQGEYGLASRLNFGARYVLIHPKGADDSHSFISVWPKLGILQKGPQYMAIALPVAIMSGDGIDTSESLQFHPTLLLTRRNGNESESTFGVKYILYKDDQDDQVAINVGGAFGGEIDRWAIRPELGVAFTPGQEGIFFHLSCGVSFSFSQDASN